MSPGNQAGDFQPSDLPHNVGNLLYWLNLNIFRSALAVNLAVNLYIPCHLGAIAGNFSGV